MSLSNYLEDALVDHVTGTTTYTSPSNIYAKLHTGDPGEAGTANAAGETDRLEVTFGAASSGTATSSNSPTWSSVSDTETYTHVSLWDNASAGNCLGVGPLASSVGVTAGDNFTLTTTTLGID